MLIRPNTNVTDGTILTADGSVANKPTLLLSTEDARILRAYKKFLMAHNLREALYCNECFSGNLSDGMRAHTTDGQIMWECRHRMLFFQGASY